MNTKKLAVRYRIMFSLFFLFWVYQDVHRSPKPCEQNSTRGPWWLQSANCQLANFRHLEKRQLWEWSNYQKFRKTSCTIARISSTLDTKIGSLFANHLNTSSNLSRRFNLNYCCQTRLPSQMEFHELYLGLGTSD